MVPGERGDADGYAKHLDPPGCASRRVAGHLHDRRPHSMAAATATEGPTVSGRQRAEATGSGSW